MKNQPLTHHTKQKLGNFSIVAGVAMLMILIGFQRDEIQEVPRRMVETLAPAEYAAPPASFVTPRAIIMICRHHPEDPECQDLQQEEENNE